MSKKRTFSCSTNKENPKRARAATLPTRVANQLTGFALSCPLVDSAIIILSNIMIKLCCRSKLINIPLRMLLSKIRYLHSHLWWTDLAITQYMATSEFPALLSLGLYYLFQQKYMPN